MSQSILETVRLTGDPAVHSSVLLAALRSRFIARAVLCSTHKQKMLADGYWHEAHEAELRRGIWLLAADMTEQEELTANDKAHA